MSDYKLPPHFIHLVQEALLKSYWYKRGLRDFLRRSDIPTNAVASLLDSETKREWIDQLFPELERTAKGQAVIQQMGRSLAHQETFPDLQRHEDSKLKIAEAKEAVAALRRYFADSLK